MSQLIASSQPPPSAKAVDGSDDGNRQRFNLHEQVVAHLAVCAGSSLLICTIAEMSAPATKLLSPAPGDNQAADGVQINAVDGSVDVGQNSGLSASEPWGC